MGSKSLYSLFECINEQEVSVQFVREVFGDDNAPFSISSHMTGLGSHRGASQFLSWQSMWQSFMFFDGEKCSAASMMLRDVPRRPSVSDQLWPSTQHFIRLASNHLASRRSESSSNHHQDLRHSKNYRWCGCQACKEMYFRCTESVSGLPARSLSYVQASHHTASHQAHQGHRTRDRISSNLHGKNSTRTAS